MVTRYDPNFLAKLKSDHLTLLLSKSSHILLPTQWTCLLICVASIWVHTKFLSAFMLMAGVAVSRLGLWMFDLSVIQQMQVKMLKTFLMYLSF